MVQVHAHLPLAREQIDFVLVLAPLVAQHLDGNDAADGGIIAAIDAAEAARGDLVEDAIAAEEIAVLVALEQFVALERGEVAASLHEADKLVGLGIARAEFLPGLLDLARIEDSQANRRVGQRGRVVNGHGGVVSRWAAAARRVAAVRRGPARRKARFSSFYRQSRSCQASLHGILASRAASAAGCRAARATRRLTPLGSPGDEVGLASRVAHGYTHGPRALEQMVGIRSSAKRGKGGNR